ncbi:MAG: ABC transporter transmembrane domain-containing protein [Paracoccaceae bacterium]
MEKNLVRFVWKFGKWDTIKTLIVTFMTFPVIYISLEIPKIIVNKALGAGKTPVEFPTEFMWMNMDQITYLVVLCMIFIVMIMLNNGLKFVLNTQIGLTSERMMRRLRFSLYESVLRFRIKRFQHMKQGEIVQSVMGEIDALSGFFGEVISTPVWQGGMLLVYMTFIFIQDPLLGAAAIALYPVQALLIPKLQKKVVLLNKQRVANVRRIADNIGESVTVIEEIHTSGTARWHLAQVADRLYESYKIRLAIFQRKYLIKGLNNFMIALTPFAFYLFGGIQVINGNLELGSLVAVLAAYKDVSAPWKELLNYFQRWNDLNSRFEMVVENFSGDEVYERTRIDGGADDPTARLTGDIQLRGVSHGPGASGLKGAVCVAPAGKATAVIGGEEGGRDLLMRMMAGLVEPDLGRVTIGGEVVAEASMPVIARSIGFVSPEAAFFAGSLKENLTYGLKRTPALLSADMRKDARTRLDEAELTGNIAASPFGDWTDYAAAGVAGGPELTQRIMALAGEVGLSEELYHLGLQARMDPAEHPNLAASILGARAQLREAAAGDREISDIVEFWDEARFNQNASLLENVLFGMPAVARGGIADYAEDPVVLSILDRIGATEPLLRAGLGIATQLVELLDAVDEDSSLLDSFTDFAKKDIFASADIVEAARAKPDFAPKDEARRVLLSFALVFVPVRDRLGIVDAALEAELLAARRRAIAMLTDDDCVVSFGEDRYSPALSVSENLLDGKRRHDRRSAWRRFDAFLEQAIERGGLRPSVTEVGLGAPLGAGGAGLSASSRRRAALLRAMLKHPETLIVNSVAGGPSDDDAAVRAAIRKEMQGHTLVMALTFVDAGADFDHVIRVEADGTITEGEPREMFETQ